jgi:hypothetical protein
MVWLSGVRGDGLDALYRAKQRWQGQLWDSYVEANGDAAGGIERPETPGKQTGRAARVDHELGNIRDRAAAIEGAVPYYIYRSLSDYTHAGLGTSRAYAPVDGDGTGAFLGQPSASAVEAVGDAPVLDVALRCCLAAMVFQREVPDPVLAEKVQAWRSSLGVEDRLPTRKSALSD